MSNPYRIEGPAIISFSGGRTSAFMLKQILDAWHGKLPDDVHVTFANTGKEREETLRFVHECQTRWGVPVKWLEFKHRKRGEPFSSGYEEVGYNSASRNGEPFEAMLKTRGSYLPNNQTRFCTIDLKIKVMKNYAKAQGWKNWKNVVGLRADEMHRVFKAIERNESGKEPYVTVMPMASVGRELSGYGRTVRDVEEFWNAQDFDLQLSSYEGNCDLCFLKSRGKLMKLIRDNPELADWWIAVEEKRLQRSDGLVSKGSGQFRIDESYKALRDFAIASPELPMFDDDEHDAECGLLCAGE